MLVTSERLEAQREYLTRSEYAWGGTLDFGVLKTLITATRVLLGGHMHPVKGRHADGGTAVDGGTYHPL
jgi:hypothetical protein